MKFGAAFLNAGPGVQPDGAVAAAQAAEDAGYDSIWTVEHVVVPADYASQYPYSPTGKMPGTEESPIPDPLIWLSYVAAVTSTIKLATGILILPQRNPVVLAKELATLDVLSRGRMLLGIGVGWMREEFEAIGVPFEARGQRCDEYVGALRELWTSPEPTYKGQFVGFEKAKSYPQPVQAGGIPIHVGGQTPAAAKRAGRLGDGFFPAFTTPESIVPLLDTMRAAARDAGRNADDIEVTTGGAFDYDTVQRFADVGVSRIAVLGAGRETEGVIRRLREFSDTVMAKLA